MEAEIMDISFEVNVSWTGKCANVAKGYRSGDALVCKVLVSVTFR